MKVSDLLVQCLEREGVEYIFGLPGEENEDLLFSLAPSSIKFIPCRHEQGAAFIANIWGRLTGRAGVCLSTLGPGATNLITGLADAHLDTAPVVAITAQGGLDRLHNQSHQVLDIVNMFRPIVKWNTSIYSPEIVTGVVRKAFKLAQAEKPGVTHLELPEDVAGAEVKEALAPLAPNEVMRANPDRRAIARAAKLLERAERPLIIAGNGAIRDLCSQRLARLAERWGIPVVSTFMGKGAISDHRDESLLTIGLGFKDYVLEAVEAADLVLTIGYDIAEYAPQAWNPEHKKRIVHIDFVPAEIYTHYVPEVEVIGDISAALDDLTAALEQTDASYDRDWYRPIRRRILDDIASYNLNEGEEFTIPGILNVIRDSLDDDGLLISDVGSHKMWIARNFPTYRANGCIITNGLASMGMALPGGIAASLVDRQRQVVAVMGDGGFLMNSQELETAVRLGVGFTIVIVNDNDYGLIKWKQDMSRGKSFGTEIGNPDFKAYAESFGIEAYHPQSLRELKDQMAEAIQSSDLTVVVAQVAPRVNNELVSKLNTYWENLS
jgi:acetolactate synthase-1/2/3 large subunit